MSLLVLVERITDEGPRAFRFRLAAANLLSMRELTQFENSAEQEPMHLSSSHGTCGNEAPQWIHRWARFCPPCLARRQRWLIGWEILFADACADCGSWLVDTCSDCGAHISWQRDELMRCHCGKFLPDEKTCAAPVSVVHLSVALQRVAMGMQSSNISVLNGLDLAQCVRLVRLLGAYGNTGGGSWPQKISDVDALQASWPITSIAAEILSLWPAAFVQLLERLRGQTKIEDKGKLSRAFRGFYSALYKGLSDEVFDFLRTEFEIYVAAHWTGAIGKRNRRLNGAVLKAMSWIPANHACRILDISRRRLNDLIEDGRVRGERRVTAGHREFIVVRRTDVEGLSIALDDEITLTDASVRLGFTKQRLLKLLPIICPQAKKVGPVGCPWAIPLSWIDQWVTLIGTQVRIELGGAGAVTLGHLIRYWPWTNSQVGQLLVDIWNGEICPAGVTDHKGVGALIFSVDRLHCWFSGIQQQPCAELSIPAIALRIGIKQEVVYALVRSGLLPSTMRKVGRRCEQRVRVGVLEEFERRYVLCREIAQLLRRSPRAVAKFLLAERVQQVAGPGIDNCRQIVFRRDDAENCLRRNGLGTPPVASS